MNISHFRRLFLFAVMVLLVMANVGLVSAHHVTRQVIDPQDEDPPITELLDCSTVGDFDFTITESFRGQLAITQFYDGDEELIRETFIFNLEVLYTNNSSGETISGRQHRIEQADYVDGTLRVSGLMVQLLLPDSQIISRDFGTFVLDLNTGEIIFQGGQTPIRDAGVVLTLCTLLA